MYIGYYAGYEVIDGRLHVRFGPDYELRECTLSETVKHYEKEKKALTGKIEDLRAENERLRECTETIRLVMHDVFEDDTRPDIAADIMNKLLDDGGVMSYDEILAEFGVCFLVQMEAK